MFDRQTAFVAQKKKLLVVNGRSSAITACVECKVDGSSVETRNQNERSKNNLRENELAHDHDPKFYVSQIRFMKTVFLTRKTLKQQS